MKNKKTKIILLGISILSVLSLVSVARASSPTLSVVPTDLTKNVGDTFNLSAQINTGGNKICVVEGTIVSSNLSLQNITMASDVMPQSSPTISNTYFLIGIPGCTTADKTLFTLSVKAENAGTASIGFKNVDLIGEGSSAGSAFVGGNYTIKALETPTPTPTPKPEVQKLTTPVKPITQPEIQPPVTSASQTAAAVNATPATKNYTWIWIVLVVAILSGIIFRLSRNKRKIK